MGVYCLQQVCGPAIVKKKQALADAPERGRAELVRAGETLSNSIRKIRTHMMNGEIGVRVVGDTGHSRIYRCGSRERCRVTQCAAYRREQRLALMLGGRRGGG